MHDSLKPSRAAAEGARRTDEPDTRNNLPREPEDSMTNRRSLRVAIMALLLTAADHFHTYHAYLKTLNTTYPLLPLAQLQAGSPTAPAARKVTLLFLDGLGYEASRRLPALQALASRGVWRPLAVEFPSYTYPGIVAYATGVPPRYSGLRLNAKQHANHLAVNAPLPSLIKEALRAQLQVRISNDGWETFSDLLDFYKEVPRISVEQMLIPTRERGLDWIYSGEVDVAGHRYGGASLQYQEAALRADALLARLIASTNLSTDVVIVVSDHGHLPRGGHGGAEAESTEAMFFAVGAGVQALGELSPRSYLDVAPTVAALLGIPAPAASMGRPMLDTITLPPRDTTSLVASGLGQRLALEEQLTPGAQSKEAWDLFARLQRGDSDAIAPAEDLLVRLGLRRDAAYEDKRTQLGRARLPWAILVALSWIAVLAWLHTRKRMILRSSDLMPTALYAMIYVALYSLAGYQISWSLPRGEIGFLVETFTYGAIAVSASFWLSWRLHRWRRLTQETSVMMLVFGLPYLFYSAWVGLDPAYLGGARTSYWVIFWATIGFYAHGPFGLVLFVRTLKAQERSKRAEARARRIELRSYQETTRPSSY